MIAERSCQILDREAELLAKMFYEFQREVSLMR